MVCVACIRTGSVAVPTNGGIHGIIIYGSSAVGGLHGTEVRSVRTRRRAANGRPLRTGRRCKHWDELGTQRPSSEVLRRRRCHGMCTCMGSPACGGAEGLAAANGVRERDGVESEMHLRGRLRVRAAGAGWQGPRGFSRAPMKRRLHLFNRQYGYVGPPRRQRPSPAVRAPPLCRWEACIAHMTHYASASTALFYSNWGIEHCQEGART